MKVYLYELADGPPQLGLHAETDYDRMILEKLEARYQLIGMGRDGESLAMRHAEIELKPKFAESVTPRYDTGSGYEPA